MTFALIQLGGPILAIGGVGLAIFLFCILPIVLGVMALRQIDQSGGSVRGRGLALLAILLGAMSLLILPILLFLGFVAGNGSRPIVSYGSSTIPPPPAVYMTVTPTTPPTTPSIIQPGSGGIGGTSTYGGSGGNGGNGGIITVTAPPVIPPPPSNTARTPANTHRSATTGAVGEQNPDDFGAVEKADPPKTNTATQTNPAAKKNSGAVGEQTIDD